MSRKLAHDEQALWARVVASVKPLHRTTGTSLPSPADAVEPASPPVPARRRPVPAARPAASAPANTLDAGWDRRLAQGAVRPDLVVDLHGRSLAAAYALLDLKLEEAIASDARVLLLIAGKPPQDGRRAGRGAIRAAVADWLAVSRHGARIAAVRPAHPRHGGAGALYIVLRRDLAKRG